MWDTMLQLLEFLQIPFLTGVFIASLATFLALLIDGINRLVNNYGDVEVLINDDKSLTVKGGSTLLATLAEEHIFIPSACGGKATCGTCKVKVLEGIEGFLPTELPLLNEQEQQDHIHLSCQIKVKQRMVVNLPEEIFSVKRYQGQVKEVEQLTHDIKRVLVQLAPGQTIDYRAGQYIQIVIPRYTWKEVQKHLGSVTVTEFKRQVTSYNKAFGNDTAPEFPSHLVSGEVLNLEAVERAYSMSSNPHQQEVVELIVRLVPGGVASTYIHYFLKEGSPVDLVGPFGDFYIREETRAPLVCVAGGSGLAPFKSIFSHFLEATKREVWFFFGSRTLEEMYYVEFMRDLEARFPHFHYVPCISAYEESQGPWAGEKGNVTVVMDKYLAEGLITTPSGSVKPEGYLCGSPGMIEACIQVMQTRGIHEIYYDKFT